MTLVKLRVVDRPQEFELVLWDGSDEAADWASSTFGDAATVGGEPGARTLTMWGTWEIPVDTGYLVERWGSFQYIQADQLSNYQVAAPPVEAWVNRHLPGTELPSGAPAEEPPAEEPAGGTGGDFTEEPTVAPQETPVESAPDEVAGGGTAEPTPDAPPEPGTQQ